jgi:hypothetical protein
MAAAKTLASVLVNVKHDNKPLTPTQRVILRLLHENGSACFQGQRRRKGMKRTLRHWICEEGLVIEAYQTPEFFLQARGLLEITQSNAPGRWYRLTADGVRRAAALQRTTPT